MRNMLALFGAALLTVVGAGWYLGWYKVRNQPASVPGEHNVNIRINTKKIGSDIQQGEEKIQQFLENKGSNEAKNSNGGLMLPSPGSPQTKDDKGSTPLFQYHPTDKQSGSGVGMNHPLLQLGSK
jgi:hypothetical protein